MIAALAMKIMEAGIGPKIARLLAWVVVGVAALALLAIAKCSYDSTIIENHEAKTSAKLERTGRKADASAAQRAEARRRAEATARKDFDNATAGIPDKGLSDRQRIDLCRELHDAGVAASLIPECSDVRSGGQARPGRCHPPAEQRGGIPAASAEQGRVGPARLGQAQRCLQMVRGSGR